MAIELKDAKVLDYGRELYHTTVTGSKGMPIRFRVTGKPKTWKTMPERVSVPLKHGMYGPSTTLSENNLNDYCFSIWEATGDKIGYKKTEPTRYMVLFGKVKVRGLNKCVPRELGEVWREDAIWRNDRVTDAFKSRQAAAESLCGIIIG